MSTHPGISAPMPPPYNPPRVRAQMSVQVLAVIEAVLGALAIGLVLQGQASAFQPQLYWTIYAYLSSLVLIRCSLRSSLTAPVVSSPPCCP